MGLRIRSAETRRRRPHDRVALAGLTNGYMSYAATPEEYDACHYEGSFTLFGRRQGPRLMVAAAPRWASLLAGPRPTAHEPPEAGRAPRGGRGRA